MTDVVECPRCRNAFLTLPGTCPGCHEQVDLTVVPAPTATRPPDRVISSRLNQTAAVGGVMIAGLLTGATSWFVVGRETGVALLLLALLVSAGILWRQ